MENRLCILTSETHEIRKNIPKSGNPVVKGLGTAFTADKISVDDLEDCENLLKLLREQSKKSLIMGFPINNGKSVTKKKENYEDSFSNWLILDFDHQKSIDPVDRIKKLPKPLANSSGVIKFASRHLVNKEGSFNIFYHLSRPISLPDKKFIAQAVGADPKIYTPDRFIFSADPTGPGAPSIENRIVFYKRKKSVVDVDDLFSDACLGSPESFESIIANCLFKIKNAEKGDRNQVLNTQAFLAAQAASGAGIDPGTLTVKFKNAASQAGLAVSEINATLRSAFTAGAENPKKGKQISGKDFLLKLALREILDEKVELFKTTQGQTFLRIAETAKSYPLDTKSREVKGWLTGLYLAHFDYSKTPFSSAINDALNGLIAIALDTEPPRKIFTRIAPFPEIRDDENKITQKLNSGLYVNLGDNQFLEIDYSGVRPIDVVPSPTTFISSISGANLPLPEKRRGDTVKDLLALLFPDLDNTSVILLSAWLFGVLSPPSTYPILFLYGSPGAGKSTLAGALKLLIDPREGITESQLNSKPKDSNDLIVGVSSELVSVIDNMSFLDQDVSDALCRIVQGATIQGRALYTNYDVSTLFVHKPIIITSIERIAVQSDLLSRAIILNLPDLKTRVDNRTLEENIRAIQGRMIHCLAEAAADGLAKYAEMSHFAEHRLASWVQWVSAGATGKSLGFSREDFKMSIVSAKKENQSDAIEAAPVALEIINLVRRAKGYWEGSIDSLFSELTDRLDDRPPPNWPKTSRGLINVIARVRIDIKSFSNITITKQHKSTGNLWILKKGEVE